MSIYEHNWDKIDPIIKNALEEDIGAGDITTEAVFCTGDTCDAVIIAKQEGVIAGVPIAMRVFQSLDETCSFEDKKNDGESVKAGDEILAIKGPVLAVLSGERLALNLLQRMSGIATATSEYVRALRGLDTKILDTRKTAPGLRVLDKYAVSVGGGLNHRFGLYDAVLIKDNHIKSAGSISNAVLAVRKNYGEKFKVEVETTNLEEVREALESGADMIMLDNMSISMMKEAVNIIDHKALTEASGNITLETVRSVAETGVDYISVGAITHSVRALDISLRMV